jgi:hypothetical protein
MIALRRVRKARTGPFRRDTPYFQPISAVAHRDRMDPLKNIAPKTALTVTDQYVTALLATAPPLTPAQLTRLGSVFRTAPRRLEVAA